MSTSNDTLLDVQEIMNILKKKKRMKEINDPVFTNLFLFIIPPDIVVVKRKNVIKKINNFCICVALAFQRKEKYYIMIY